MVIAQEAKFELIKYNSQGKNYPDNKDYGYALTEYLIKLYDADGHIELYHVTDYYNEDISEITSTKIWELSNRIHDVKNDSRLGIKILGFITSEHFYRNDVLESMYVKDMEDKIDSYYEK